MKIDEPTSNPSYNAVLLEWHLAGYDASPECEECGCDLTDRDVVETKTSWLCMDCAAGYDEGCDEGCEDFHADL